MEVDEKKEVEVEVEEATAAAKEEEEEEENGGDDVGDDGDHECLTEALEWLGLAASLSAPSVTLVEIQSEEKSQSQSEEKFVDVCSFEGLLGSGFASRALEAAAAAAMATDKDLPWVALVLVGFPDSPLAWTEAKAKAETKAAKKKAPTKTPEELRVRLGPEACREHALFFVVVRGEGEGESSCRFLAAVASGGGDGFASRLL